MLKDIQAEQLTGVVYSAKDEGDYIPLRLCLMKYHVSSIKLFILAKDSSCFKFSFFEQINLVTLNFQSS